MTIFLMKNVKKQDRATRNTKTWKVDIKAQNKKCIL